MTAGAHKFFDVTLSERERGLALDERIGAAVRAMGREVGVVGPEIDAVIAGELALGVGQWVFGDLEREGVPVAGKRILDMGAGLGAVSVEAVRRGAQPVALEPGEWRGVARDRLAREGAGAVVGASGESLPFEDATFDLVLSVQVLEHVKNPEAYLREAYRVLKPGGHLWLSCENYLSFRENHYKVAWFPLLPKPLGEIYLRLRGRPTAFLRQSVTYTTPPQVIRMLRSCGFALLEERAARERVERAGSGKLKVARDVLGADRAARWALGVARARRLFRQGMRVLAQKPGASA